MLQITVNHKAVDLAINRLKTNLEQRRPLLENIGARIMGYTRNTIAMQGRGKGWKPLAESTKKSTGRSKALVTLIPFIRYRVNNRSGVTVYFSKKPKGWSLDMHERGFSSRAVKGKFMKAPRLGGFMSRKKSVIPARKVWPSAGTVKIIVADVTQSWLSSTVKRSWR